MEGSRPPAAGGISCVPDGNVAAAPLVSAIMPCYRQEQFVRDALDSILAQDYSPLEIIVADDASPDRSLAVILETVKGYRGPHSVRVLRSDRNRGIENYRRLFGEARGDLLVECHSDDLAHPDRISKLVAAWRKSGATLISSNAVTFYADNPRRKLFFEPRPHYPVDSLDIVREGWKPWLLGATFAYARDLVTTFAPLQRQRSPIEIDWILPLRASLMTGIHVLDSPLLDYRIHEHSVTAVANADGERDTLVRSEAVLAQQLGQFMYMLDTLYTAPGTTLAGARLMELRQVLVSSILRTASEWSGCRHSLRGRGFKLRWFPPE
jgi:hypothetical protein